MARFDRRAAFVGMGLEIIVFLLLGVWLGSELDKKFALNGMATAGLVVLALVLWFLHLLQMLKGIQNDPDQKAGP